MAVWQRPARVGLASFAVTFGITLLYTMSDRAAPPAGRAFVPVDPAAVMESRGARITLGNGTVIVADRQFAYDDGSARLVGVEVIVPAGDDRTGFRIRSGEAAGVEETGEWRLAGAVTIETGDGLSGSTSEASYADATGVVTMPEPAVFEQGWMRLAGDAARYDRRRGLVNLDRRAVVELQLGVDGDAPSFRIAADGAEVDRLAGVMRFTEAVTVDAGGRRMQADAVVIRFDPDASRLDVIELSGGARVLGQDAGDADLREMSAETIVVTYRDDELERAALAGGARILGGDTGPGQLRDLSAPEIDVHYRNGAPERATLSGGARVELFGERPGAPGASIAGGSVEVALQAGAAGVDELHARERVTVGVPRGRGRRPRHPGANAGHRERLRRAGGGWAGGGIRRKRRTTRIQRPIGIRLGRAHHACGSHGSDPVGGAWAVDADALSRERHARGRTHQRGGGSGNLCTRRVAVHPGHDQRGRPDATDGRPTRFHSGAENRDRSGRTERRSETGRQGHTELGGYRRRDCRRAARTLCRRGADSRGGWSVCLRRGAVPGDVRWWSPLVAGDHRVPRPEHSHRRDDGEHYRRGCRPDSNDDAAARRRAGRCSRNGDRGKQRHSALRQPSGATPPTPPTRC